MANTLMKGGQTNAQLTRTFERIFEEAQISSELKLSGRKLKDFPKIASKYDLSDTVRADLSKNRFTDLPCEVCEFFLLERLDFYNNLVRCIPDSVLTLQSLAYLNLSRNQLSFIPPSLCQLPLQVLNLSNNKLVSLPEEIGHMPCLNDLDVSCNEIAILPPQIGDIQALRSLVIRRNMLVELRPEICELRLQRLDISGNRIQVLPTSLRLMTTLEDFSLDHNPLTSPPAFLCTRGKVHIFKYLEIQSIKEDKKRGIMMEPEYRRSGRRPQLTDLRFQNGFSDLHRKRYTVDSGYNTSDGCDKSRWSQDLQELNGEVDESRNLTLRATEYVRGQSNLLQRSPAPGDHFREDSQGRSSECRRQYPQHSQSYKEYKESLRQNRADRETTGGTLYRKSSLEDSNNGSSSSSSQSSPHTEVAKAASELSTTAEENRAMKQQAVCRSDAWQDGGTLRNGTGTNQWRHFTMRRELDREREEKEILNQMRQTIETRLKVALPEDIASALTDGVVLCHLANSVRAHSVATIHVPSPAVPTLSQPKCRRNVENFLDACRRIGVPEAKLCGWQDICPVLKVAPVWCTVRWLCVGSPFSPFLESLLLLTLVAVCIVLFLFPEGP